MAEAIGFAIASAVAVEVTAATATIIGSIALAGASIGAQYLLASSQKAPRQEAIQAVLNQSMALRRRIYGKALVGGVRNFWEARNGDMTQSILLCSGRIDAIEAYFIGDGQVGTTLGADGGFVTSFPFINKVYFEPHLGFDSQTASAILLERYPDVWTADHRLDGVSYCVVVFLAVGEKERNTVYPQGANTSLRFLVRGARVYRFGTDQDIADPGTWTWSDNPADCIMDYIRHADGMRQPLSRIDVPSFLDFASLCYETVARKDASTESRYRLWGVYEFGEEPNAILARMCATCDARLYQGPTGLIGIRGGQWVSPLVNIPTSGIVKASLTQGNDKLDSYNRIKVSYTEPEAFFQTTEIQSRDDLPSQAAIGVIDQALDLQMVPSFSQAARLAKIKMARDNPLWRGTLGTHVSAIDALTDQIVSISYDPFPEEGEDPFMEVSADLTAFALRGDGLGCELGFSSLTADAYDWNPDTEEPPRPVTPAAINKINTIDAPTGLAASVDNTGLSGGVSGAQIVLIWTASPRPIVVPEAQFAVAGSGAWQPMAVAFGATSATTPILTDGGSFDLRVRFVLGGTSSAWSTTGPVDAVADPTLTGPPTGFVANGGAGSVMLAWTAPNSANVFAVRLYRAATGVPFSSAAIITTINLAPNQAFDMVDSGLSAGGYDYWVRALNRSGLGDATSTAGPATATVT